MTPHRLNHISHLIIQAAIEVHRILGPGLLESIYRACLIYELRERGLTVAAEQLMPLRYKGMIFDAAYRIDLLVENEVIVELKSIASILDVHEAQVRSYLRLADKPLGLLMNFNVPVLVKGLRRIMNGADDAALNSKA